MTNLNSSNSEKNTKIIFKKAFQGQTTVLGEYQQMPDYFEAHNISEQTEAKNALIEKLLKLQNVKTVFDMTCGTGSQVFYLAERGYEVIGSDLALL